MKGNQLTENEIFINLRNQNMLDNNTMLLKINMKLQVPFIMLRADYLFAHEREKAITMDLN